MLLVSDQKLNHDVDDCHTTRPIEMTIKSKQHFNKLIGRNYRLPHQRAYRELRPTDTDLIGQTILLRSPITCACKDGICKTCYGNNLYYVNKNINVGAYAGTRITNPLSQAVLSTKHLLTTSSEKIEFTKEFYTFFTLTANEIMINSDIDDNIDINDYSMVVMFDDISFIGELNTGEFSESISAFYIKNNKTGEMTKIEEVDKKDMYISQELLRFLGIGKRKKESYEVNLGLLPEDTRVLILEIENNELTRPLYMIMGLLDTKAKRAAMNAETIDDMAQIMLDLLIESKINAMSIHGELIIAPLIRSEKDILKRPNFARYVLDDMINIMTIESALEKHPSITKSLSFQALGRQITNPLTYKKHESSFLDPFFKEKP